MMFDVAWVALNGLCRLAARMVLHNPPVENPCLDSTSPDLMNDRTGQIQGDNCDGFPTGSAGRGKPLSESERAAGDPPCGKPLSRQHVHRMTKCPSRQNPDEHQERVSHRADSGFPTALVSMHRRTATTAEFSYSLQVDLQGQDCHTFHYNSMKGGSDISVTLSFEGTIPFPIGSNDPPW
jgi:hypothetical protein